MSSQQLPLQRPPTPADTRPTLQMPPPYADPYFDTETMAMIDRERRALFLRRLLGVLLAVASLAYIIAAI